MVLKPSVDSEGSDQTVDRLIWIFTTRVMELSYFITCPWISKWSKSTYLTQIYLPENWHFAYFSKKTYVVGTHKKCLGEPLFMSTHNILSSSRNKKNIYLIIWILFSARSISPYPRTSKLKFLTSPQGNGTSWTSQAWYFHCSVHH